jgi:hypothetical protein
VIVVILVAATRRARPAIVVVIFVAAAGRARAARVVVVIFVATAGRAGPARAVIIVVVTKPAVMLRIGDAPAAIVTAAARFVDAIRLLPA